MPKTPGNKLYSLIAMSLIAPLPALADTSETSVYGVANMSFDLINSGTSAAGVKGTTNNNVASNASRLGFKGAEDLGGGLSAKWQIESAIALDNAGGTLASRNSFAALGSKEYGTLLLGRYDTPYKISTRKLDDFSDSIGDNRSLMGSIAGKSASVAFDAREPDTINYTSPDMGGFSAALAYNNLTETAATAATPKAHVLSMAGMYHADGLDGTIAYEVHNLDTVRIGGKENAWKIGGGYKFNDFSLGMVYEKTSDTLGGSATTCTALAAGANCMGHSALYMTGKYSFGLDALKAAYTRVGNLGNASNTGANQYAVGYEHHMSKSTMLFAVYTKLNNDTRANYGLGNTSFSTSATASIGAGSSLSTVSMGMRHSF